MIDSILPMYFSGRRDFAENHKIYIRSSYFDIAYLITISHSDFDM